MLPKINRLHVPVDSPDSRDFDGDSDFLGLENRDDGVDVLSRDGVWKDRRELARKDERATLHEGVLCGQNINDGTPGTRC